MNFQRTRPYPPPPNTTPTELRAVVIGEATIIRDDGVPIGAMHRLNLDEGLAAVLNRVATAFPTDGEGVVLFSATACGRLGLPTDEDDSAFTADVDGRLSAIEASCRTAGWSLSQIRPWTTFHQPSYPTLHVGLIGCGSLCDQYRYPFAPVGMIDMAPMHAWWHELTGSAYRGTPGMAGTAILRDQLARAARKPGVREPTWHPTQPEETPGYELPFTLDQWQAPTGDGPDKDYASRQWAYEHGYDVVGQHLAAMGTVEVSAFTLRHTGAVEFDSKRAGWWLIRSAPWWDPRLPDPMGYTNAGTELERWVTTPTVKLLADLSALGVHGGFQVLDSWTGPGTRRVLKPFSDTLRNALHVLARVEHDPMLTGWQKRHLPLLRKGFKQCYAETFGLLGRAGGRIHRPDWHHAIVAEARSNLWRKLYRNANSGRWPLRVDHDNVWYGHDSADPVATCPEAFILAEPDQYRLGRFKVSGSRFLVPGDEVAQ